MTHILNFTGPRDALLSVSMELMLRKLYLPIASFRRVWNEYDSIWGNGAGWEASMMKVQELRKYDIASDDFLVCIDSDVMFFNLQVFEFVARQEGNFYGIKNEITVPTLQGDLNHIGGCLTFIRGDILKKINEITDEQLFHIRNEFKAVNLCENEDVVISYLAKRVGATVIGLPEYLWSGGIEWDIEHNTTKSFYHVNYSPTTFLDEPVTGKWDLPKVLIKKGLL